MNGDGRSTRVIARLPLQVGSTANYRVPGTVVGLFLGVVLAIAPIAGSDSFGGYELGALIFGLLFVLYGAARTHGAVKARASDLVLEPDGLRIEGGPHGGTRIPWSDLASPMAKVVETHERQLRLWRILYYVPIAMFLFLPLSVFPAISLRSETTIWQLWLIQRRRGPAADGEARAESELLVARTEREIEARSMEAAAASIAAVVEGQRYVEQAPAIEAAITRCPHCGAPAVLADADEVPCRHCGGVIPLLPHVRGQAAAGIAAQESRTQSKKIVQRLLRQPGAFRVNAWLVGMWLLLLPLFPAALLVAFAHVELSYLGLERPMSWVTQQPWLLLPVPFVALLGSYVLGCARLVNRRAMQLLTLGFGALAPARDGEPARCRQCHAPLSDGEMGGVTSCAYCGADNIFGIDLRPFVDKTRAEKRTFDEVLADRQKARWSWGVAALIATALFAASTAAIAGSALELSRFEEGHEQACERGEMGSCTWLYRLYRSDAYYVDPCEAGHHEACALLADTYNRESWRGGDRSKARAYYERACNGGLAGACFDLGLLLVDGGGEDDQAAAVKAYEQACDGGEMGGCVNLGVLYTKMAGEDDVSAEVFLLYRRACDGNSAVGCHNLALYHERGRGTPPDVARARALYARACDLGYEKSCGEVERLKRAERLQDPEVRKKLEEKLRERLDAFKPPELQR
jgi:TPR repeat protein